MSDRSTTDGARLTRHALRDATAIARPTPIGAGVTVEHIVCYGTLMRGESHHALLTAGDVLDDPIAIAIEGTLWSFGAYPALSIDGATGVMVYGECYHIPSLDERLAHLDAYEGYDPAHPESSEYRRIGLALQANPEETLHAWCYVVDEGYARRAALHRIASGSWRDREG
ncbi:MAG: gamma-glutamylcyclotransferase [Myxococcales bacterium]|nr:gamma-glutamylcyclotransferase [Myxococcales bacterium]